MITGWYDQQIGTIENFTGMAANARTEKSQQEARLIIGPWSHTWNDLGQKVGQIDFGPEANRDYYEIAGQWFARWLKDGINEVENWPPAQIFVMGSNICKSENEWPLARTVYTDCYLCSSGNANSIDGNGTLSSCIPGNEPKDSYIYDPRVPLMTLYSPEGQQEPHDQRSLNGRFDVLVYVTDPLDLPLEVIGPVEVKIWASSSTRDTDFVAKLIDVWPNGFAQ